MMATRRVKVDNPGANILYFTYALLPIIAGADKFLHWFAEWHQYLAAPIENILPFSGHMIMYIVGVIEIAAGIIVLAAPRIGGYIVGAWLLGIVINLIIAGGYLDIAIRDAALAMGAFALAALSKGTK